MLKKVTATSLAAIMALTALSACGGQTTSSGTADTGSASTAETSSAEEVTITYISSTILESPEGDFEQQCIDEFNALDNGIHVEVEGVNANDLMKKYITLATSNSMPDFFLVNLLDTPTVVDMGLAAEVTPLFGEEYISGFDEASLASASVDGVAYGIPWFGGASGVLYRKDIFDEKGIEVPTTWEEMVAAAQALTDGDSYGITLVGTNNGSGAGRFQYVLRNFGVDEFTQDENGQWVTDIGSQKYIDALRAYTDLDEATCAWPPPYARRWAAIPATATTSMSSSTAGARSSRCSITSGASIRFMKNVPRRDVSESPYSTPKVENTKSPTRTSYV